RREVVLRRTRYEHRKAEEKAHLLEGLKIALDHLDEVIALIRRASAPEPAREALMARFGFSQPQAQAILDMKLQRLTGLERDKILSDYQETIKRIEYFRSILGSDALIKKIIKDELLEIKERYQDARKTEIIPATAEINLEDMIAPEEMVITVSHTGYIKRSPLSIYRSQRRGGKGKIGMGTKEEDFVEQLFVASSRDFLLFFTDAGRIYWQKVYQMPEAGRVAKGKAIINLLQLAQESEEAEKVTAVLPVAEFREDRFVVMATKNGNVKKTDLSAYSNPRAGGIIALTLDEGDRLVAAHLTDGHQEILLGTRQGMVIRFAEEAVRPMGRSAMGVRGIDLYEGDEVITMEIVDQRAETTLLTVTQKGYGKRTAQEEYRTQGRGGKGILTVRITARNGQVVSVLQVDQEDEVIIITAEGKILRLRVEGIRVSGRNTQGVKLIEAEDTRVVGVAILREREDHAEV
ncbi:MAG: DNA gyrase C-terminal beta-propeller domain-containing protein, partial [Nitrospiria bacterium]